MNESLHAKLEPCHQQQLLAYWDQLDDAGRNNLAAQIERIDFALLEKLYRGRNELGNFRELAERASPPPAFRLDTTKNPFTPQQAREEAEKALRAGTVGTILVAGGQGTRLGFDHPKGMYVIGPVSNRTLFQIHVEKIVAASKRYGVKIPLYLMTSPATHEETIAFFKEHKNFGLPEDDLMIFCQGTMPAVDEATGRVLLEAKDRIALSPDGHGGMLAAMEREGVLDDIERRGIKELFYFQVDNPLVDICGREFLGYHLLSNSELSTQVIAKREPLERVGNVVQVDGRLMVIEYSDLPEDVANRRNPDGSLEVWAGSIAVHVFSAAMLRRLAGSAEALPFHLARKKVAHLDERGERVEPNQPNAIKFERFIFDLLPSANNAIVVEIDPQEGFGPLKNASGAAADTPEMVRGMICAQHRRWLQEAGATVGNDTLVEISPLYAIDEEELAGKLPKGTKFEQATYLDAAFRVKKEESTDKADQKTKFKLGDRVRVKRGEAAADYPDVPIGGWAGTITLIDGKVCGIEWSSETLANVPEFYRKRCKRDGFDVGEYYAFAESLLPDSGGPLEMELPENYVATPLSEDDPFDRVRSHFGLTSDDPLPALEEAVERAFYQLLKTKLTFPFAAKRVNWKTERRWEISVVGLCDESHIRQTPDLLCEALLDGQPKKTALSEIEVSDENDPNGLLILDYQYWLDYAYPPETDEEEHGETEQEEFEEDDDDEFDEEDDDEEEDEYDEEGEHADEHEEDFDEEGEHEEEDEEDFDDEFDEDYPDPSAPSHSKKPVERFDDWKEEDAAEEARRKAEREERERIARAERAADEFFHGLAPDFRGETLRVPVRVGRNEPCPCGSGKKFKKCCLEKSSTQAASARSPFPVGTLAFYGPDYSTTTKIVASVFREKGSAPTLKRWVKSHVKADLKVQREIKEFFQLFGVKSIAVSDGNMSCPHEEGKDFPLGGDCPFCPFWKGKQGSGAR
jgi:UDP-N-acetylglucosamine/UDP-N-acetylgalactosamine diphosphorylase